MATGDSCSILNAALRSTIDPQYLERLQSDFYNGPHKFLGPRTRVHLGTCRVVAAAAIGLGLALPLKKSGLTSAASLDPSGLRLAALYLLTSPLLAHFDIGQLAEHAGEADRALGGVGQGDPLPPAGMAAVALSRDDRVDLDLAGAGESRIAPLEA